MSVPRRRLVLLGLAGLAATACGRRGPPVAPGLRAPEAVADLNGVVQDGAITLTWSLPRRRVDDTRLPDLAAIHVYRTEDAGVGPPKPALLSRGTIAGYTAVATIRLADPAPAVVQGGRVSLTDRQGLTTGRRYTYVVTGVDAQGRVGPPSIPLTLVLVAAAAPPRQLTVEPGDREARLRWEPPARLVDGRPATGPFTYQVLRAPAPDAPLQPLPGPPLTEPRLTDRGLENEQTYAYAVRAIRMEAGTTALGEPTPRVTVTPADLVPPSPPSDLVAIPARDTVRLSWRGSPEPDVAAYVIYRTDAAGVTARVGSTRPPDATFVDRGVPPGTYRYTVTAQDASVRANESAPSEAFTVTVP
jgi:hypothetical protein